MWEVIRSGWSNSWIDNREMVHVQHCSQRDCLCPIMRNATIITKIMIVSLLKRLPELECNPEDAYTKMFLHTQLAAATFDAFVIRCPDADVTLLPLYLTQELIANN